MKREEKLLRAIGYVDDNLIAGAMEYRRNMHPNPLRWIAVAACLCLLLTATVCAVKWTIEWQRGRQMGYILSQEQELKWTFEEELGHTVEWKYPLAPVTIRQEAYDEMNEILNRGWSYQYKRDGGILPEMADYHFSGGFGVYSEDAEKRFSTIADLEAYLGINLAISPEIDAAARNCMETNDIGTWLLISSYGDINRDAEEEYLQTGQISLQGIKLEIRMGFSETNCKSWMEIIIPLTQKFADTYPTEVIFNVYEKEPFRVELREISGREVLVIQDSVDLSVSGAVKAYGIYGAEGIGYCVHCLAEDWGNTERYPTVYQRGLVRLLELLEYLE